MRFLKFINRLLTFVLCVVLVIVSFVFLIRTSILYSVKKDPLTSSLNKTNFIELLTKLDSDALNDIYEELGEIEISKDTINNVLDGENLKGLIANYISGTIDSVITKKPYSMKYDTIRVAVVNTIKEVNKEKEIIPETDEVIDELTNGLERTIRELPTSTELLKDMDDEVIEIVRLVFGKTATNIFIVIVAVSIILMMLFLFSLYRWMLRTGVVSIISGLLIGILGFFTNTLLNIFGKDIEENVIHLIKILTNSMSKFMIMAGIGLLVFGIIQILIEKLINNKKINNDTEEILQMTEKTVN